MKKWVEENELQDEWKNGLEFGCFATMLRMFLVFDSFILRTRFSRRSLEPDSNEAPGRIWKQVEGRSSFFILRT